LDPVESVPEEDTEEDEKTEEDSDLTVFGLTRLPKSFFPKFVELIGNFGSLYELNKRFVREDNQPYWLAFIAGCASVMESKGFNDKNWAAVVSLGWAVYFNHNGPVVRDNAGFTYTPTKGSAIETDKESLGSALVNANTILQAERTVPATEKFQIGTLMEGSFLRVQRNEVIRVRKKLVTVTKITKATAGLYSMIVEKKQISPSLNNFAPPTLPEKFRFMFGYMAMTAEEVRRHAKEIVQMLTDFYVHVVKIASSRRGGAAVSRFVRDPFVIDFDRWASEEGISLPRNCKAYWEEEEAKLMADPKAVAVMAWAANG
jgi:hypothetical protein